MSIGRYKCSYYDVYFVIILFAIAICLEPGQKSGNKTNVKMSFSTLLLNPNNFIISKAVLRGY